MRPLILLLLTTSLAFGQDSTIAYKHRYIFKLDPSALVDLDRTVQVGLEFPINHRTSWQTTVGYGWTGLAWSKLKEFDQSEVWRVRNEVRFYTGRYRTNRSSGIAIKAMPPLGNYWAVELLAKQINIRDKVLQMKQIDNQTTTYSTASFLRQRYALGGHIKIGRQIAVPAADKSPDRLLYDVFIGVGLRYVRVTRQDPQARYPDVMPGVLSRFVPGNYVLPSLVAGIKMGFAL
ncbi:MAG: DUF3575 domain-containing protein [Cytophagales bacterium]|nr:MAG: DUF3575 domain-containing protein [Cytophagales bacterium]